jgi:glucosamine 6-phosphate synthetase-like amidotransferase/phosphosugar isomerase protein
MDRHILVKNSRYAPGANQLCFHTLKYLEKEIRNFRAVTLIGVGTSYHSALAIKNIFQKNEVFDIVQCLDAVNLSVYDLLCDRRDNFFILISQNSENKYIEKAAETISTLAPQSCMIGVFNNILASFVRTKLRAFVLLNAGIEFSLSFVKSFVSQFFCLYLMSKYFEQIKNHVHSGGGAMYKEIDYIFGAYESDLHYIIKNQHFFRMVAEKMARCSNVVVLGGSDSYPFVLEAAQKFRDISYMDSFGVHFNQLHHGYFNIVNPSTFLLIFHDRAKNHTDFINTVHELLLDKDTLPTNFKSLILSNEVSRPPNTNRCDCDIDKYFDIFPLPGSEFHGVNCLVASMYLAYYVAVARNYSPDHPRSVNLQQANLKKNPYI